MLSVILPVNSRLLVVKFLGSQKLHTDFQLHGLSVPLTTSCIVEGSTVHFFGSVKMTFDGRNISFSTSHAALRHIPKLTIYITGTLIQGTLNLVTITIKIIAPMQKPEHPVLGK